MARDLCERTVLPPAGHAAINQPRIALGAVGRAEPKTLHDARPIAFDQRIGGLNQRQRCFELVGTLQIEGDNPFSPPQWTFRQGPVGIAERGFAGARDRDNFGAEIGKHAACKRTWADPLELDHLQTCKRMHRERSPEPLYTGARLTKRAVPRSQARSGNSAFSPCGDASATPRSVMSPVTSRAGVTSNAGLAVWPPSGAILTRMIDPSSFRP